MIGQLEIPIYDTNVLFLLDVTEEEFTKFLDSKVNKSKINESEIKAIFDDIADDKLDGTLFTLNGCNYVSLIKKADDVGNYTHELFHIADQILKDRGIEYTETNEALAYLIGWLNVRYSHILEKLKPQWKPTKKQMIELDHLISGCSCEMEIVKELQKQLYEITGENLSAEECND